MQLFDDIKTLISRGDTSEGIQLLLKRTQKIGDPNFKTDILSLANQYFSWERENQQGLDSLTDKRNRIIKALLACMDDYERSREEGREYKSIGKLDQTHRLRFENNKKPIEESKGADKNERRVYHIIIPLIVALIAFAGLTHKEWLSYTPSTSKKTALNLHISYANGMPFTGEVDIIADGFSKRLNIYEGEIDKNEAVLPDTKGIEQGRIKIVGESLYTLNPQFVYLGDRLQEFQILRDTKGVLRPTIKVLYNRKNNVFVDGMWIETDVTGSTKFSIEKGYVIFPSSQGIERKYEKSDVQLILLNKDRSAIEGTYTIKDIEEKDYTLYVEDFMNQLFTENPPRNLNIPKSQKEELKNSSNEGEDLIEVTIYNPRNETPKIFVDGKPAKRQKFSAGITVDIEISKGQHQIELRWKDQTCKVITSYFEGGEVIMQSSLKCN